VQTLHAQQLEKSLAMFDDIATMGSDEAIAKHRTMLLEAVEDARLRYFQVNSLQNPFRDVERYVVPLTVGVLAYIGAKLVDSTCSTDFCEVSC
jgi:hypothetical protein